MFVLRDAGPINETLPFVPMSLLTAIEIEENKDLISDVQQSPIISTLEKREEVEYQNIEPISLSSIIPIIIDVDPKPVENPTGTKLVCFILSLWHIFVHSYRIDISIDTNDLC